MTEAEERRRFPGTVSAMWCRSCEARFAVAGRQRQHVETPTIELIVCPCCKAMRRMVLPASVGLPFRIIGPGSRRRAG